MPLFELYRRAQEKLNSSQDRGQSCSADLSFIPENEFVELRWENGQVVMQGQSSRPKKSQSSFGLPSEFTSQSPWISGKGVGNGAASNAKKFEAELDSGLSEFPMSTPPSEMCLTHDEDIVPWFNCPINEPLRNDYSSDFLPELPGVPVNELSNLYSFDSTQKSKNKEEVCPERVNGAKVPSAADVEITGMGMNTALPSLQQGVMDTLGSSKGGISYNSTFGDFSRLPRLAVGSTSEQGQAKDTTLSAKSSNFINFSHFARVAAPSHSNIENHARASGLGSSNLERTAWKEKYSSANDNITADNLASNLSVCPRTEASSNCQVQREQPMVASKPLICQEDALKNDKSADQSFCASSSKGSPDNDKMIELVAASSSVCSGNSAERASDAPPCSLKRKCPSADNSDLAEDVDEDSVGVKKAVAATARSTSSKRSRAAEVHNLSERRRRDRINEKMRALQELIPNCNKVDKASMLDEAIEYLKSLQLQVQMMSMANGLYMPPMMFPTGIQRIHPSQMAQFSPMGIGMGLGVGMVGVNCGTHVPMPHVSASNTLHRTVAPNFPLMGLPGQGLPMSMPCLSSLVPFPGVPLLKPGTGPKTSTFGGPGTMENTDAATTSSLKESIQNVDSASCVTNHTSSQFQGRNGDFQKSTSVQNTCPASDINGRGVADSANRNSTRLVREDCSS